jgi:hypothetical protein
MRAFLASSFLRWLVAVAALAFAVVTASSIGLFVMPVAFVAIAWAAVGTWRPVSSAAGAATGFGAILVLVGALNTFESCEAGAPCQRGWGLPVLLAGVAIVVAALAAARSACRRGTPA